MPRRPLALPRPTTISTARSAATVMTRSGSDEPFAKALEEIARVMRAGVAAHGDNEWTRRSVEYHLGRAEEHLRLLHDGDQQDHLSHAATRLLMALTLREVQ